MGIATTTREEIEQMIGAELPEQEQAPSTSQAMNPRPEGLIPSVIKTEPGEDIKPTLRMTVLSQRRLLQWQGTGDEELIITKVTKGNDPLADFYEDAEATQEIIEVEETDSEDDISEVSMQSNGDVNKAELRAVLQGLTNSHQAMANHLSTLSTMVTGMNEEQVDETAARVATELGAVQGWQHIVDSFDRAQIALLLAVGVRKIEEFEILKGKRAKDDVTTLLEAGKDLWLQYPDHTGVQRRHQIPLHSTRVRTPAWTSPKAPNHPDRGGNIRVYHEHHHPLRHQELVRNKQFCPHQRYLRQL